MNYPSNPIFGNSAGDQMQFMKGTTGVAFTFADGAVIASDRRASMGTFVASKTTKKVFKLNEFTGMGIAGLASDGQALAELMKSELQLYKMENNFEPTVKVAGSLLSTILHSGYRRYQLWYVQLLVAGVDRRGSHVYSLDPSGTLSEENFMAIGSGTLLALGIIENSWKADLTKAKAKELAITALKTAISRDAATGNGIDGLIFTTKEEVPEEIHVDL